MNKKANIKQTRTVHWHNDVQLVMYFETSRRARLVAGADTSHVEVSEWKVAPSKPPKDIP